MKLKTSVNSIRNFIFSVALLLWISGIFPTSNPAFCSGVTSDLDSLKEAFLKEENLNQKGYLLYKIGWRYSYINPDTAIQYFKKGYEYALFINDYILQSSIAASLSQEYRYSKAELSAEYAVKAVEAAEKSRDPRTMAFAYATLGNHYIRMQKPDEADSYIRKSLKINKKLNDTLGVARDYHELGIASMLRGEYDEGLDYWKQSVDLKLKAGLKEEASATMGNIALYYKDIARYYEAKEYLDDAISIQRDFGDYSGLAFSYQVMGEMYNLMENYRMALPCFDSSIFYYNKLNEKFTSMEAYLGASVAYRKLGDYKSALENLQIYLDLATERYDESRMRILEDVEKKYETEKKEQENLRLQAENELQGVRLEEERTKIELQKTNNRYLWIGLFVALFVLVGIIYSLSRVRAAKRQVEEQKFLVEEKNKEITASISYAKYLQEAILPADELFKNALPESFVLYLPKDIVAGDFYWLESIDFDSAQSMVLFAAADCTGHGVPGAMVSVVCHNALNRSVREFGLTDPGKILDKTTDLVIETFEKSGQEVKDGMDIALCLIDKANAVLHYAGANNSLYVVRNSELIEYKANKQPVGKHSRREPFTSCPVSVAEGDVIYLFTDGYADQFGGPAGKKFKYSTFKQLLMEVSEQEMAEQCELLRKRFEDWKGTLDQVDDVCVIGVRV